ncbi:unnamed protein product [Alopecurus aequalis]
MRGLVGAAGGYYGNCAIVNLVALTTMEVANSDIKDVVKLIRSANNKIQSGGNGGGDPGMWQHRVGDNSLMVSSWRNIGLEAPNFGGGRAARVIWYVPNAFTPLFVLCPPRRGNDGVKVMGYIVKGEDLDAFTQEIAARSGSACGAE